MAQKPNPKQPKSREPLPFGKRNYLWFGIALVTILVGYIFLGSGSITIAPILLVLGYCVLVPVAILIPAERKKASPVHSDESEREGVQTAATQ